MPSRQIKVQRNLTCFPLLIIKARDNELKFTLVSDMPILVPVFYFKRRWSLLQSMFILWVTPLQWRHNGHDGVSNHQPRDCLLNRLFKRRSKKTSKLRVTGLCEGNSPVTGEFPSQRASNAENVSIWWRHHGSFHFVMIFPLFLTHIGWPMNDNFQKVISYANLIFNVMFVRNILTHNILNYLFRGMNIKF